mgnify:FL=1|tara:strand:- start:135 stop:443 length:309 start_codon:yes stop_codon:yes gene_type:complete
MNYIQTLVALIINGVPQLVTIHVSTETVTYDGSQFHLIVFQRADGSEGAQQFWTPSRVKKLSDVAAKMEQDKLDLYNSMYGINTATGEVADEQADSGDSESA